MSFSIALADKPADTFDLGRLTTAFEPVERDDSVYAWDLTAVRQARDYQMRGDFRESARLAEALKTDPQIFGALLNRLIPHRRLSRTWSSANARITAEVARTFAADGYALNSQVIADLFEWVIQLGVFVGQNVWTPRADGGRVDVRLEPWPMASVWWDSYHGRLMTYTTRGVEEIVHGDGKGVVAADHASAPWQWGTIKAVALDWPARAFHKRDRSMNSETHGEGKFLGTLPEGMTLNSPEGKLFSALTLGLKKRRAGGVKPFGSTIELLEAVSQMFQIFEVAIKSLDKDIARAYLGQDGSLVNEGGNYIKAAELAGVRYDLVEGDLSCASAALKTGTLRPWSIVNTGRDLDISTGWALPDPDEQARRMAYAERTNAFNLAVREYAANSFTVDQAFVKRLALEYGIDPPALGEIPAPSPTPATPEDEPR